MHTGMTHIRYDHGFLPNKVEVVCPNCEKLATAITPCFLQEGHLFCAGSCPPSWEIRCSECAFRTSKNSRKELGDLFYRLESRGKILWAWNQEHLEMLYLYLSGENVEKHPYGIFATYIRREWLQGTRKKSWVKVIARILRK
jgi:hypothetical protein